jgi:hypothetical protein
VLEAGRAARLYKVPGGEKMIYIIILIISVVLLGAAVVGCFKPGKKDGICNYDNNDKKEEFKK